MADSPQMKLRFEGSCPDCGVREVYQPPSLPDAGDDFDWRVRNYDDFRMFMLEELSARFPERTRWTPADLEVVLENAGRRVFLTRQEYESLLKRASQSPEKPAPHAFALLSAEYDATIEDGRARIAGR